MNKAIITSVIAALALTFVVTDADARGRRGGQGRGEPGDRIMNELDLTADQQQAIRDLRQENREEAKALRDKERKLRDKMQALWDKENPEEDAIIALHRKIHKIKGQLAELRIELRIDIHKVLTPEQRVQARDLMKKHRAERKDRRMDMRGKKVKQGKGMNGPKAVARADMRGRQGQNGQRGQNGRRTF